MATWSTRILTAILLALFVGLFFAFAGMGDCTSDRHGVRIADTIRIAGCE